MATIIVTNLFNPLSTLYGQQITKGGGAMPHTVYYCYVMIGIGSNLILKCFDMLIDMEQVFILLPK